MNDNVRYSDAELQEFKEIILQKLEVATHDFEHFRAIVMGSGNGVSDTSPTFKMLEEGAGTREKEEAAYLAERQRKFINNLKAALVSIENKTYGICRATGKLIPKERLRAVPHATMIIEQKVDPRRPK